MHRLKPLRYFEEDLTQKQLRKTTTKAMNLKFTEHVYGHKLDNAEKHRMIMDLVMDKKHREFNKTKRSKRIQKKKITNQRQKIENENKRKMLEVKWKTKLSKLSLDLRKQKIQKNHWRIGDFTKGVRKSHHGHNPRRKLLRRRIYTPNTENRLNQRLKTFKKTNEYGLTPAQIKKLEEEQKEKEEEILIEKKRTEDGKILLTKKKVLKRYKHTQPDEEVSEEPEELEAEEEEDHNDEDEKEEDVQLEEAEPSDHEEEKKPETPIRFRRYKPLYPQFEENDGVEDLELPKDVEQNIHDIHNQEAEHEDSNKLEEDVGENSGEEAKDGEAQDVYPEDEVNLEDPVKQAEEEF